MKPASYALREVLIALFLLTGLALYFSSIYVLVSAICLIILLFMIYFFRDPERNCSHPATAIVSPADGRIVEITEGNGHGFIDGDYIKIGVFLSIFDVHVNRSPTTGRVKSIIYENGGFLNALNPNCTACNENNNIVIFNESLDFTLLLKQIAGFVARRIVCDLAVNDHVKMGERIGMIKLGSRTEVYLPRDKIDKVIVKLNDKVKGGLTVLAIVKDEKKKS